MPPRWSRIPTRQDPEYRKLDDRMNFAVHFAVFALCNSGAWFFRTLQQETWTWTFWLTAIWLTVLVGHAIYVFAIADYSK
ncbi:MAG: 2TM domain-containing protein [Elainella sp.]